MNKDYQSITMEIDPEYYKEGFHIAVLRDTKGYFGWARTEVGWLHKDLDKKFNANLEVLAIFYNVNTEGFRIVDRAIEDLKAGKNVDLEMLLKPKTE